jgi:hypothetical protein
MPFLARNVALFCARKNRNGAHEMAIVREKIARRARDYDDDIGKGLPVRRVATR